MEPDYVKLALIFTLIYNAISVVIAIIAGFIAKRKNRYPFNWGFFTFLFPPAILILLALKPLKKDF